jgi:thiol-disulfide isomerase/thioredoxin
MEKRTRFFAIFAVFFALGLMVSDLGFAQGRQAAPPEIKELITASRIKDPAARLKEFERIKAAYPASRNMAGIERAILNAKVELAGNLDAVLALQKEFLAASKGPTRLSGPYMAANQILSHPKLATFNKAAVLAAVLKYRDLAVKVASEPDAYEGVPARERDTFRSFAVTGFGILVAQAQLNAGDTAKALAALEAFRKEGGAAEGIYFYTLGATYRTMGKTKDAYEAYLAAAADGHEGARAAARELHIKLNGKADGFEAALEAKLKALPYEPEAFKAPAAWKGKAVLAELFTGSECPPCVGADLGFDGLIKSYPTNYLAVLEYHLPIPRPDPMMNPATKKRQEYYGIDSTPTVVFDGEKRMPGGGPRGMAEGKYRQYKAEVDLRLGDDPAVSLKVRAVLAGDTVKIEYDLGKALPGTEYQVVLVQGEESYKGSNGLAFHKLVVRDLVTVEPAAKKKTSFDLAASERAADQYLTDFETTNTRFQGFKFPERHFKIDRAKLSVVLFAQDKATKKVLNAAVAEVAK